MRRDDVLGISKAFSMAATTLYAITFCLHPLLALQSFGKGKYNTKKYVNLHSGSRTTLCNNIGIITCTNNLNSLNACLELFGVP